MKEENNIKVTVSPKGGVGKSTIAKILATVSADKFKKINLYEIDNNNSKGNLESEYITHKIFKINDKNEALFDISFNADDKETLNIIDCGGGDDTDAVIEALAKNRISGVDFYIPMLTDVETVANTIAVTATIKKHYPKSKITLVLNKITNLDDYQSEFINIFGSERYGYVSEFGKIEKDIDEIALVPEIKQLIFLMKAHHQREMVDLYKSSLDLEKNLDTYRKAWIAEAKEKNDRSIFDSNMELFNFGTDLIEFVNSVKKTLD